MNNLIESRFGNINLVGRVNNRDAIVLADNFGTNRIKRREVDLDDDGKVGFSDFAMLITNYDFGQPGEQ